MTYNVLIFAYRKEGWTPEQFKDHYETKHLPLMQSIGGSLFPLAHTRRYLHREKTAAAEGEPTGNAYYPATVPMGSQSDFDYDAIAELEFEDADHFQRFSALLASPEFAPQVAADTTEFMAAEKTKVVIIGDVIRTQRSSN
ncbi:hypothetical protein JX266_000285 [Neoarthrinium moseri]|uniref:uncharacterized protein n=1 Tax=Neoarthrinium moseri TaxID=1658444 RepID=UPI001FDAFA8D|nr:uncharacterized protein JN550_003324 [Neoarthrinium moseri]KAI1855420.1 hypothetical protein JX266_000285 [Neoarthrinium moseri]KAI1873071.1 hypothetical protein JN550_003324 [Neoarthrinium moseri]